ncbi:MAG: diguanylate cyclase [Lachnospiraceae bacterium]|nr:diguanylate cyclase [Lachnospiraceae bacterium]
MEYWIVVVDDEPLSLTNAKLLLNENGMRVSCLRSGRELLRFMDKNSPDLILLDILMPEMDGFATYNNLRQNEEKYGRAKTPVIFLTGENNRETERRGLKAGASDFIRKPFDRDILLKRIKNTIINSKTIENLTEEASLDKLTGFLNKASGTDRVGRLCGERAGALMIFDLDNFKLVNDLYGHDMGDRVLVAFSEIVRLNIRAEDVVSRVGGDEFMAYFPGLTEEDAVRALTVRLNEQFMKKAEELMGEDHGIPVGISVGAAFSPAHTKDYQLLFQYADSSLYKVKQNGRHSYAIYDAEEDFIETGEDLDRELIRITRIMEERGDTKGALFLNQDAFSWDYRFIMRFMKRYNGIVNRFLISLSTEEKGVVFSEIVAEFGSVMRQTLRRCDIIFQCKPNQFFVVLPQLTEHNAPKVIRRILGEWEKKEYHDRVKIRYATATVSSETDQGK